MRFRQLALVSSVMFSLGAARAQTDYVHFESPQTQPVRLSPSGERLFSANTADSRLSVFDLQNPSLPILLAEIPVGLEPVSVNARSEDEVWVVNHVSDSVSVVSVSQGIVVATLEVGDEPCDVVFAGGNAFVSAARSAEVWVFDANTRGFVAIIPLLGEHPRALAVSPDGTRVYAAFALSGNGTTTLLASQSPPQPPPTNPALPAPPQVALIVDPLDPMYAPGIPYSVLDHDVAEIDVASLSVSRYFDRTGTIQLGLAVHPTSGDVYVANTDARNLTRFLPALRGHFVDSRITRITTGVAPSITPVDLNPNIDYAVMPNPAALSTALAEPTAMVFHPDGSHLYVAAFGTDRVAKVDSAGVVLSFIEVGPATGSVALPKAKRGPRGLALRADTERLYVQNRLSNTLSVVDTAGFQLLRELPLGSHDPTPSAVREGRGFLYDAKLSGNGMGSCASCHVDADEDHLAWDIGDPGGEMQNVVDPKTGTVFPMHPMKGPMVSLSMKGLRGFEPFNWRGDRADIEAFGDGFDKLLGGQALGTPDRQLLRAFVDSVELMPNPYRNLDGSLPATVLGSDPTVGAQNFQGCTICHGLDDNWFPQVVKEPAFAAQATKVPDFREFYKKAFFLRAPGSVNTIGFGGFHDGTASTTASKGQQVSPKAAFFLSMSSGMGPAVGHGQTLSSANANDPGFLSVMSVMEAEAALGDCDLIGKGTVDGVLVGLWFDGVSQVYQSDTTGTGPFLLSELRTKAVSGNAIVTFHGTPPGTGQRMGVDRDGDGLFDGDEQASSFSSYGSGCVNGSGVVPLLQGIGIPTPGGAVGLSMSGAAGSSVAALLVGIGDAPASVNPSCLIEVGPVVWSSVFPLPPTGGFSFVAGLPEDLAVPTEAFLQVLTADPAAPFGVAASNGLKFRMDSKLAD